MEIIKQIKKPVAPCLGCPDRAVGCHTKCVKYADYVRRAEIWRKYLWNERLAEAYKGEAVYRFMSNRRKR